MSPPLYTNRGGFFMFGVKALFFILLAGCSASYSPENGGLAELNLHSPVHDQLSTGMGYSVSSAVKIISVKGDMSGHGSGNYFKLRGERFIMTAAHNVTETTAVFVEERNGNTVGAKVVFMEQSQDVAILKLDNDLVATKPVPYKINAVPNIIGKTLYYTSNPSQIEYILTKAFVSKSEPDQLMLQANAWYGSSGAVVFDKQGRVCGTVTGILVGHGPIVPQGLENYVFVSRVSFLTKDRIQEILGGGRD